MKRAVSKIFIHIKKRKWFKFLLNENNPLSRSTFVILNKRVSTGFYYSVAETLSEMTFVIYYGYN